ncbi:MAG: ATP-binding protein [Pyrinomonadaceae bacterium]
MKRQILIIDDHDDLASSLGSVFSTDGHIVKIVDSRKEALDVEDLEQFDLVITDLDVDRSLVGSNGDRPTQVFGSDHPAPTSSTHVKAFKICATNFRRDDFDEKELRDLVDTVLNFKIKYVDTKDYVKRLHERIEFELPSSISPMHSILEYLTQRVEKLGVINCAQSNLFVALDEAFVNAVKHGNKFDANKLLKIVAELSPTEASFTVEDEGEGFDINSIPDPLDPENLFKSSGRGVLFICSIMDEVKYNERGNRLTMIKKCDNRSDSATYSE